VFVPASGGRFDVVNHVDIDSYLKSVVSRELLYHWHEQAYLAQAIAARTYALYEANTSPPQRHYDLFADQRSQVYGGIDAESRKSIHAVEQTAGIVLAYGPPDRLRIFKSYFSACCGGVTLSVGDAFNESNITPLWEQRVGSLCNASPRFNWGPVQISKRELTRRIRAYAARRDRPEKAIEALARIDIEQTNPHGRPRRFILTDANGARYSIGPEELRNAINHDAGRGPTVYSSFFRPHNDAQSITFTEGHGHGHGVGMCQWCAQVRAAQGMRHEQILMLAYPESRLVRAY
jgi:stage II sporulation protein D